MGHGRMAYFSEEMAFIPISAAEYQEIGHAQSALRESTFIEEEYDILIENYLEFETTILDLAARSMILGQGNWNYHSTHLARGTLDRRLVNLLTASRMYQDHVKQRVRAALDRERLDLGAFFSDGYDARLGYRCMEALRNHVQHTGLPVHSLSTQSHWTSLDESGQLRFAVTPRLNAKHLQSGFKKAVLREIEAQGGSLDLKALARDYMEGLSVAHSRIRKALGEKSQEWEEVFGQVWSKAEEESAGRDGLYLVVAAALEDGERVEECHVFEKCLDRLKFLRNKNEAPMVNLTKRYVTGEVIPEA